MQILDNISLKPYNTFGIDVKAKHFASIQTIEELKSLYSNNNYPKKFLIGGGSNMLLTQDIDALVIHLNLQGIQILKKEDNFVYINVKAGQNWHDFVLWTLDNNYGGLENMSLIPGNVGTAPIQNIGAYGVELKDVFYSCEVLNLENLQIETLTNKACNFGYRNSIFKNDRKSLEDKWNDIKAVIEYGKGNMYTAVFNMEAKIASLQVEADNLREMIDWDKEEGEE